MVTVDVTALADAVRETRVGASGRAGKSSRYACRQTSTPARAGTRPAACNPRMIERDTGTSRVAFIPGEEFAHTTVNVTVNRTDPEALARRGTAPGA